jgi:hypothetical protein
LVKKLLSGILGKKEDKSAAADSPADEVPDELPPLAEDVLEKAEEESPHPAAQTQESPKENVPENLPPLELPLEKQEINYPAESQEFPDSDAGTVDDLDKEDMPEAIKMAKMAKLKTEPGYNHLAVSKPIERDSQKNNDNYTVKERVRLGAEVGFFSNILEHINKQGGSKEKLLSDDLFARMSNYWELRKHNIKSGTTLPAEQKLEEDLKKNLGELKLLEQKWQVQKLALEEDVRYIHEREREIQGKIEELKLISNELASFKNVKPGEYFYLNNRMVLKNLHDLIDILEVVDDETYKHHVSGNRNDFSEWIQAVFKNNELAEKVKNAGSKMEIIEALEKAAPVVEDPTKKASYTITDPKKYFWLGNNTVIRNLFELSDALKVIDDKTFEKHVNDKKNDFALWAEENYKNEHLTERIQRAKTKEQMIEILEVFL